MDPRIGAIGCLGILLVVSGCAHAEAREPAAQPVAAGAVRYAVRAPEPAPGPTTQLDLLAPEPPARPRLSRSVTIGTDPYYGRAPQSASEPGNAQLAAPSTGAQPYGTADYYRAHTYPRAYYHSCGPRGARGATQSTHPPSNVPPVGGNWPSPPSYGPRPLAH